MAAGQSKVVRAAYIVAFIAAGLSFASLVFGPSLSLLTGATNLVAGLGIKRGRAWSAYGLALFLVALLLVVCISLLRTAEISEDLASTAIGAAILILPQIILFLFAGRSLWQTGPERGEALPWVILAAVIFVPFLFAQVFTLPAPSMEDTLMVGDTLVVLRFPRLVPARGDVLVFRLRVDPRQTYVKRVVGVAGDRIKILDKRLFRNSVPLDEPYVRHAFPDIEPYRDNFPSEPAGPVYPRRQRNARAQSR